MKFLKENSIVVIWLLILAGWAVFSFFGIKITANLHVPEKKNTSVVTKKSMVEFKDKK